MTGQVKCTYTRIYNKDKKLFFSFQRANFPNMPIFQLAVAPKVDGLIPVKLTNLAHKFLIACVKEEVNPDTIWYVEENSVVLPHRETNHETNEQTEPATSEPEMTSAEPVEEKKKNKGLLLAAGLATIFILSRL